MTRRPTTRQMFRNFLGGFTLGVIGLAGLHGLTAEASAPAPTHMTAQQTAPAQAN